MNNVCEEENDYYLKIAKATQKTTEEQPTLMQNIELKRYL